MLRIKSVSVRSNAYRKGVRAGHFILSVNGKNIDDQLDLVFNSSHDWLDLKFISGRSGYQISSAPDILHDISFEPLEPMNCGCNCIFCFVAQLPRGLRRDLYVKDEDYRYSYLYGTYITLYNVKDKALKKISRYRLSPLYISAHSTDPEIRRTLLGVKESDDLLSKLRYLAKHRIEMHTQVVLCPGINDGDSLIQTVRELSMLYPWVSSVAVVPVGLTAHRQKLTSLNGVKKATAVQTLAVINGLQAELSGKFDTPFVWASDEFYIKAGVKLPSARHYGDFSQLENGVGLMRKFIDDAENMLDTGTVPGRSLKRIGVISGELAAPMIMKYFKRYSHLYNIDIDVIPVRNSLLGSTVTVAGLISGADVISAVSNKKLDVIVVPNVMLRERKKSFLDDLTLLDVKKQTGIKTTSCDPSLSAFHRKLKKLGLFN